MQTYNPIRSMTPCINGGEYVRRDEAEKKIASLRQEITDLKFYLNQLPAHNWFQKYKELEAEITKYKAFWEDSRMTDKMQWERRDWPKHNLYTASRCRKDGRLYGKVHMAEGSQFTLCGLEMNENCIMMTSR